MNLRVEAEASARSCGRAPSEITLMAVVKTRTPAEVAAAAGEGLSTLGENRVQEGLAHIKSVSPEVRRAIRLHFIGRLQANKARKAMLAFDSIDSVDSESLASRLSRIAAEEGLQRDVMIEVNLGLETQKGGVRPGETVSLARVIADLPNLTLTGLMGIPPYSEDPEDSRAYFRRLAGIFRDIRREFPDNRAFRFLSMGMSNDYKVAIEEGATMIRIGTALFGARRSP
jgi:pyridoxal phosphate enzyme (YggS family)